MDATRHLGSSLLVLSIGAALVGLWADRAPEHRCQAELDLVRARIQLMQLQRELDAIERRIDDGIRNLELADSAARPHHIIRDPKRF